MVVYILQQVLRLVVQPHSGFLVLFGYLVSVVVRSSWNLHCILDQEFISLVLVLGFGLLLEQLLLQELVHNQILIKQLETAALKVDVLSGDSLDLVELFVLQVG